MSFNEQMKQKVDEVHLQDKAKAFGDALAEVVKAAVGAASGYAAENRPKVDAMLDKAERTIAQKAGAKHADTVTTVRGQVDKGIDKLVAKRESEGEAEGAGHAGAGSAVPDDTFTAFPDEGPTGSAV
jgi:uncharacterized protein YicC (UPF0701 family)